MSRRNGVTVVTSGKDETALQRIIASHRLAILAIFFGLLSAIIWWADLPRLSEFWPYIASASISTFAISLVVDPVIAVYSRWPVVAADSGLLGRRGGVPTRWAVFPAGWRKTALVVSRDSILPEDWDKACSTLAQGFGFDRVRIVPVGRNISLIFSKGRSPIEKEIKRPLSLKGELVLLGIDERGKDFWLDTDDQSAMVIGGLPGSGKTVALLRIAQTFAQNEGNRIIVFDGKGSGDFAHRSGQNFEVFSGTPDRNPEILARLRDLEKELHERAKNNVSAGRIIIIVDEAQAYLDASGTAGAEKKALEEAARILKSLVALGRSLGFFTIVSTQKPDSSSMPTRLRDNAALRAAGRLRTSEAVKMVFGESDERVLHLDRGQMVIDPGRGDPVLVKIALPPES